MTVRREEHVDEDGRTTVITTDEPTHTTADVADSEIVGEETVVHSDPWSVVRGVLRTLSLFVLIGLAVVETLLGFRLGFLLAGANPTNGFVDFIYDSTEGMVEPFGGIVTNEAIDGGGTFESATLIAMIVWALVGLLIIAVLMAIGSFPSASGERSAVTRSRHSDRTVRGH